MDNKFTIIHRHAEILLHVCLWSHQIRASLLAADTKKKKYAHHAFLNKVNQN